jgi:hypothetical protein
MDGQDPMLWTQKTAAGKIIVKAILHDEQGTLPYCELHNN